MGIGDPTVTYASIGRLRMSKWGRSGSRYLLEKGRSAKGESVFVANSAIEFRVDGAHSWLREWVEMGARVCIKRWTGKRGPTGTKVNHKRPFYSHLAIFLTCVHLSQNWDSVHYRTLMAGLWIHNAIIINLQQCSLVHLWLIFLFSFSIFAFNFLRD